MSTSDAIPMAGMSRAGQAPGRAGFFAELAGMLREPFEFRELLRALTRRDVLVRYHNALLGGLWAIGVPLLHMAVFTVIFTRVAPIETGVPYALYAYTGLLPWTLFAQAQRFAATSLTANPHLVGKVAFPREVLPFSAVLVALFDFAIAAAGLAVLLAIHGIGTTEAVLFLPVVLLVQLALTAGVALAVAMANLFYADVKYLLELLLTVGMFATSVVYPVERVGGVLGTLLQLNPLTPIIGAYRAILLEGTLPAAGPFAAAALVSVAVLFASWLMFHRAEHRFAEEV